jgi:hypothetical protein
MTEATNWRDVKAKSRAADPTWDSAERVARRPADARLRQWRPVAEIRQQLGSTQVQHAEATGLTQARISQIENGDAVGLGTLRAYATFASEWIGG